MKRFLYVLMLALMIGQIAQAESPRKTNARTRNTRQQTLQHQVPRPRVALVVGGGGAKGAAAIGAMKAVEASGIPIDMVVGTSAGAIITGLYAVGYNAQQLDSIYRAQDWIYLLSDMAAPRWKPWSKVKGVPGMMRGERFTQKLDSLLGGRCCSFDSLPIPLRCVAVDVRDFREVTLDSGNVAQAIRASMSVPLAFTTVEQDSMLLVDGGLLNNLPVDVARSMGADYVIAIDLMDAKRATQQSRGEMHTRGLVSILEWKYVRPDLDKYQVNRRDADVLIHPDVEGYHGASFSEDDTRQLIARGEEAGRAALDKLAEIRQRVQPEQKGKGSKGSKGSKGLSGSKGSRSSKGSREYERRALKFGDK